MIKWLKPEEQPGQPYYPPSIWLPTQTVDRKSVPDGHHQYALGTTKPIPEAASSQSNHYSNVGDNDDIDLTAA